MKRLLPILLLLAVPVLGQQHLNLTNAPEPSDDSCDIAVFSTADNDIAFTVSNTNICYDTTDNRFEVRDTLTIYDGTTDSPKLCWTPATGTEFCSYVEDTTDDMQIEVNTGVEEILDLVNAGAGTLTLSIDGNIVVAGTVDGEDISSCLANLSGLNTCLGSSVADGAHFSPNADPGVDHSSYVAGHGDGANCSTAGQWPAGVDGSGAVQGCGSTLPIDGADQTTDGQLDYDSTEEVLEVGDDGTGTLKFYPGAHFTPTAGISTDHGAGAITSTTDLVGTLCGTNEILEDQGASWACIATPTGSFTSFDITDTDASPILTVDNAEQIQFIGSGTVSVTAAADASNHDVTITGSSHFVPTAGLSTDHGATAVGDTDIAAGAVDGGPGGEIQDDTLTFDDMVHTITLAGNPAMAASQAFWGLDGIIFEGQADDTVEALLQWLPTVSDKVITIPNATGIISLIANSETLTNKTLTSPTINTPTLNLSTTADPTADGRLTWNTTSERLQVGDDGVATYDVYTGAHSDTSGLEEEAQVGTTNITGNAADDQILQGTAASAATWATVPDCNTNNMLTYTQSTNTWGCDADDGAGGGAPTSAQYVVGASDATLTAEKILTDGTGIDTVIAGGDAGSATINLDYTATLAGDPALNLEECVFSTDGTGGGILCEGATADAIEGLLVWSPTTSDRTLTLPDATDTIVARDTTDTLQNKTLSAANNVIEADTGDSATAFFSAGTFEDALVDGGNERDEVLVAAAGGNDLTCAAGVCDVDNPVTAATTANNLAADGLDAMSEIAAGIKRGPDATDTHLLTTDAVAPGSPECLQMDTDGSVTLTGAACGAGATDTISEGDSSVEVIDAGTGQVDIDLDAAAVARFDATGLTIGITDATDQLVLPSSDDPVTPTLAFGGDTGFYETADGSIAFSTNGGTGAELHFNTSYFAYASAGYPMLDREQRTATNPVHTFYGDGDTGVGGAADAVSLIAGGVEGLRVNTAASGVTYVSVTPGATGVRPVIKGEGEANTGLDLDTSGTGTLNLSINGTTEAQLNGDRFYGLIGGSYTLENVDATATVPTHSFSGDVDSGMGQASSDDVTLIGGGAELLTATEGQYGSAAGDSVLFIPDLVTAPTSNPTGGVLLYSDANTLYIRDTTGTATDVLGAGVESNDLEANDPPTILDTEIYVGNGAGSGTFVTVSGDASLANTGALTIANASVEEAMLATADFGDWSCGAGAGDCTLDTGAVSASEIETAPAISGANIDSYPENFCKTLFDSGGLANTDDIDSIWRFKGASTVTEVWCETDTGTATITLQDGGATALASSCSCTSAGGTCTLSTAGFTDGELLDFVMVTAAGNRLTFCVEYDLD